MLRNLWGSNYMLFHNQKNYRNTGTPIFTKNIIVLKTIPTIQKLTNYTQEKHLS